MTVGASNPASSVAVNNGLVAESLLSWTKDVRYIHQFQELLEQVMEPWLSGSMSPSLVTKGSWYSTYLLYILLVLAPKGRTLGMEVTGLKFDHRLRRHSQLIKSLLLLTIATCVLDWWATVPDRDDEAQTDGLRGQDRRRRHEVLRQEMLHRANGTNSSSELQPPPTSPYNESAEPSLRNKLEATLRHVIKSITGAVAQSTNDGPFTLRNTAAPGTVRSLASWLLKLHLAQYTLTGKFPTILHRILGVTIVRVPGNDGSVPVPPATNRITAFVILAQASAVLTRHVIKKWTDKAAHYLEKPVGKLTDNSTSSTNASQTTPQSTCAICQTARTHPAMSSLCGHVFCWNCLNHWVSTVKEACPYCRTPCATHNIQPLYQYDPQLGNTG